MSAIFGFVHFDGRPASKDALQAMAGVPAFAGCDAFGFKINGSAAFGHALVAASPESDHEAMPARDPDTGILLTAAARLDNRDDLLGCHNLPLAERAVVADSRLVGLCFNEHGESAPEHLYGDWSFAAWSEKERRLFLARDQLGNTGLYVYQGPNLAVFSSSLHSLLAHPGVPRELDELVLGRFLLNAQNFHYPLSLLSQPQLETPWKGVFALGPGHALRITPGGGQAVRYWSIENAPSIRFPNGRDYLEGFLERFQAAVDVRLRSQGPLAATLSAGLDSGAVTALAARTLRAQGRRLTALTSVPQFACDHLVSGTIADEWPMAQAVARAYPNIDHLAVSAENTGILEHIKRDVAITGLPTIAAGNAFWISSLIHEARNQGARVLLTGQMGNNTVSWSGHRFGLPAAVERLGKWMVRKTRIWSRANGHRPEPSPSLAAPGDLDLYAGHLHQPIIEWLERNACPLFDGARTNRPAEPRAYAVLLNAVANGPFWHTHGTAMGIEVRDPTTDARLAEYCLGIPDSQFASLQGRRLLIRRAMHGILPDEVRIRARRGRQAADLPLRMRAQQETILRYLESLHGDPAVSRVLDVSKLCAAWRSMEQSDISTQQLGYSAACLLRGSSVSFLMRMVR